MAQAVVQAVAQAVAFPAVVHSQVFPALVSPVLDQVSPIHRQVQLQSHNPALFRPWLTLNLLQNATPTAAHAMLLHNQRSLPLLESEATISLV
jgi:hypothetical protein